MAGILHNKSSLPTGQTSQGDALVEPLIPKQTQLTDDSESSLSDELSLYDEIEEFPEFTTPKDIAIAGAAAILLAAGVAASASAMLATQSLIVYIAGGICILNSPVVGYRQYQLAKGTGPRKVTNLLRKDIERFRIQNDILSSSVEDLQAELHDMHGIEEDLQMIAIRQGENVSEIIELVKENEDTLKEVKKYLREIAVADITRIVMMADQDGDLTIDIKELSLLSLRLQIKLEAHGIDFDTEKFESMVRKRNNIQYVLKICGALLLQDDDEENDDSSVDTELTFESEEDFRTTICSEEKFQMFTVQDKYTKGSVESARGSRITLAPKKEPRRTIAKDVIRKTTKMRY